MIVYCAQCVIESIRRSWVLTDQAAAITLVNGNPMCLQHMGEVEEATR